jgi:hypothetical protein
LRAEGCGKAGFGRPFGSEAAPAGQYAQAEDRDAEHARLHELGTIGGAAWGPADARMADLKAVAADIEPLAPST